MPKSLFGPSWGHPRPLKTIDFAATVCQNELWAPLECSPMLPTAPKPPPKTIDFAATFCQNQFWGPCKCSPSLQQTPSQRSPRAPITDGLPPSKPLISIQLSAKFTFRALLEPMISSQLSAKMSFGLNVSECSPILDASRSCHSVS